MALNPTTANWLRVQSTSFSVSYLLVLTLFDGWTMKIVFTVSKTKPKTTNMAFKANSTPSGEFWCIKLG